MSEASGAFFNRLKVFSTTPRFGRLAKWIVLALALWLTVVGGRLVLIDNQGTDVPYWDQWGAELQGLIRPYWEGSLDWRKMIEPHNEHRILLTRLLTLGLFVENGQWDGKLQMTVNVFIQSMVALGVFWLGRSWFVGAASYGWWLVVVAAFALPFGYDNTLVGFQSQFYLMSGLSLGLFWLGASRGDCWWWRMVGLLIGGTAVLFTTGSGFLAAGVLLGVLLLQGVMPGQLGKSWRQDGVSMAVLLLVAACGMCLLQGVPQHDELKAGSLGELCNAAARCFAWPWSRLSTWPLVYLLAIALWLPWTMYFFSMIFAKRGWSRMEIIVLALGSWVALQMMAMVYSRGAGALPPASRYADTVVFGLLANFLALRAMNLQVIAVKWQRWKQGLVAVWIVVAGSGMTMLTIQNVQVDLPERWQDFRAQQVNVARFIADDNPAHLLNQPFNQIPYEPAEDLVRWLREPAVRAILPFSVREPLQMVEEGAAEFQGLTADGLPSAFPVVVGDWLRGSFLPDQGGRKSKGSYRATFEAPARLPYVGWMVAGHVDDSGSQMTVRPEGQGKIKLLAADASRGSWQPVFLRVQRAGAYELAAKDNSISRWLAFTPPKEVGRLSRYAVWVLQQGYVVFGAGLLLLLLLVIFDALMASSRPTD